MYYNDHHPAHFHAEYAEYSAEIAIGTLEILSGVLPHRATGMVLEWAFQHRSELRADWERLRAQEAPIPIMPLQ